MSKLYREPYKYPRICCIRCHTEVLEIFTVGGHCVKCQEEITEEVSKHNRERYSKCGRENRRDF